MTDDDEREGRRVVILGVDSRDQLFPGKAAIGETLTMDGYVRGKDGTPDGLTLPADVEQPGTEGQSDPQARADRRTALRGGLRRSGFVNRRWPP